MKLATESFVGFFTSLCFHAEVSQDTNKDTVLEKVYPMQSKTVLYFRGSSLSVLFSSSLLLLIRLKEQQRGTR